MVCVGDGWGRGMGGLWRLNTHHFRHSLSKIYICEAMDLGHCEYKYLYSLWDISLHTCTSLLTPVYTLHIGTNLHTSTSVHTGTSLLTAPVCIQAARYTHHLTPPSTSLHTGTNLHTPPYTVHTHTSLHTGTSLHTPPYTVHTHTSLHTPPYLVYTVHKPTHTTLHSAQCTLTQAYIHHPTHCTLTQAYKHHPTQCTLTQAYRLPPRSF